MKLYTPDADCIFLLTELDPDDPDVAFGLVDMGMGYPELGNVRISEIESVRGPTGLRIQTDPLFAPDKTIKRYAVEAQISGRALGRVLP